MATSTNYGWAEPDNSSLVKNGASDIRTLGNAIDTSVWNVGFGQAGKNKIINGDFGIWQRSTSTTVSADATYYAPDRFASVYTAGGATVTWSRQTFTPGTAPVAGYGGIYFSRLSATSAGASTEMGVRQLVENVQTLSGQTATFSFWAKADSARTASIFVNQVFGSGGSTAVTVNSSTFSVTTSWTRFSVTLTVPSISGKTVGTNSNLQLLIYYGAGQASGTPQLDLWGIQLETGSLATPFQTASGGSVQGELAMCQRYYYRITNDSTVSYAGISTAYLTTAAIATIPLKTTLRVTPTAVDFSSIRVFDLVSAATAVTAVTLEGGSPNTANISLSSTPLVIYRNYYILGNTTPSYLGFSAEL